MRSPRSWWLVAMAMKSPGLLIERVEQSPERHSFKYLEWEPGSRIPPVSARGLRSYNPFCMYTVYFRTASKSRENPKHSFPILFDPLSKSVN